MKSFLSNALFSTLGRTAARGLECQWSARKMKQYYNELITNIKAGDLATANTEKWEPSSWPAEAKGVAPVEAPRGALAHWVKINTSNLASLTVADQGNVGGEDIAAGAPRSGKVGSCFQKVGGNLKRPLVVELLHKVRGPETRPVEELEADSAALREISAGSSVSCDAANRRSHPSVIRAFISAAALSVGVAAAGPVARAAPLSACNGLLPPPRSW